MILSLKVFIEAKFNIAIDEKAESEITTQAKFGKEYFLLVFCSVLLWAEGIFSISKFFTN